MSNGIDRRAQIDTELVKGLVLTNGGAAAGLLAFLPNLLQKQELYELSSYVLLALFVLQAGLVFALVHNHLRRRCSLAYESQKSKTLCGEPVVCCFSHAFMWLSVAAFVMAGIFVYIGGSAVVDKQRKKSMQQAATTNAPSPKSANESPANILLKADGSVRRP